MKILITGGAGYIGSVLTPVLLQSGYSVTVLDNYLFGQTSLLDCCYMPTLQIVRGDCRDRTLLKKLLEDIDVIIPLAALVGAPLCDQDVVGANTVNLEAIQTLLQESQSRQKIIFPTTNSGYGIASNQGLCTEETPLNPISLYGRTKVAAERAILERGNSISLRLATVFGVSPRMRTDLLVNDFVYRAVRDRALVVFQGNFRRNFIHIRDVAGAFIHCLHNFSKMKENVYNVGLDSANLSKIQLCEEIKRHVPDFHYFTAEIGEDPDKRDYIVSSAKIANSGFAPQWSLPAGIIELKKAYTALHNRLYSNV